MTSDRLHGKESAMDEQNGQALDVALAYHEAWTSKDLERAMTYVADDIVCDAPAGRIEGAEAYRAFMGPFVQILKRAELIAAFGDDRTAIVVYDTDTVPVHSAPGAECVTVEDGRIVYSRFIFDRAPFDAARANAG
jgi:SnoaL-like protein